MRKIKHIWLLMLAIPLLTISCKEEPIPVPEVPEVPELTRRVNSFIELVMNDIYYWADDVPEIDIRYEADSEEYFYKLLNEEDVWSFVTDDIDALEKSFEGVETSFGYSLAFGRFSNTDNIFAVVEFVYPDTPAAKAGIQRSDIIIEIDGQDITDDNYTDLLYASNLNLTRGILGEEGIYPDPNTVNIAAKELNLDPVMITEVVEHEGRKIGYLFYAQYIGSYLSSLNNAFDYFMDEGISDLVIDLRYNPGGVIAAAKHLCSSIAPLSVVNGSETLVTYQWNDTYQKMWEAENVEGQLRERFSSTVPVKMGLNKVYFLTGNGSASASELTITGLKPYMDVTTIGETTYGKYTGSITFKPEDYYSDPDRYKQFANWGVQPIVLRYANSQGVTDFKNGFDPDIPVEDDLFSGFQLGDKEEPLFKAAVEDITGAPVVAMKKARIKAPAYTIFDRGFSKFDANKRELLIDNMDFEILKN